MKSAEIKEKLFALRDLKYQAFQARLVPEIPAETIIGVRTPQLRALAKEIGCDEEFLSRLPHEYFEENQLHSFIIAGIKDFGECISRVESFLPFIDNWAVCDQLSPKIFKKHKTELLPFVKRWICSDRTYTVRFGILCLLKHFLDEDFDEDFPELVCNIPDSEYYIYMAKAWYFAEALAKQYDTAVKYIENRRLPPKTHNKAIQKAVESFRITDTQKQYLKSLKAIPHN